MAGYTPFRSDTELSLACQRHYRALVRQIRELRKLVDELKEEFDLAVENHQRITDHPRHSVTRSAGTIISRILQQED